MSGQRKPRRRKPPRRKATPPASPASPAHPPAAASAPAPVVKPSRGAPPRKRVARPAAGAQRSTAAAGARPKPQPPKEGISVITVFLFVVALLIAGVMLKVMIGKDLGRIKGYPTAGWPAGERNLLAEAQDTLVNYDKPLVLDEATVNAYLRSRIKGSQGGPFSAIVKYVGTYVDFEPGYVDIYVVRKVLGKSFPIGVRLTLKDLGGGSTKWMPESGTIGGLSTGSKQFEPVARAILRVASVCEHEVDVLQRMGRVTFQDDQVTLSPKY